MQPSRALFNSIPAAAAADTAFLAAATSMHVHLAIANFTPDLDLDIGTLVEATFTGGAALDVTSGVQDFFYDVSTGLLTITLLEPAGGWTWVCTVDPLTPETVYGCWVSDTANTGLIGSFLLDSPVTIAAAGEGLTVGNIKLRFKLDSPF